MFLRTWSKQAAQNIIQVFAVTKKLYTTHPFIAFHILFCSFYGKITVIAVVKKQTYNISEPMAQGNHTALKLANVLPAGNV